MSLLDLIFSKKSVVAQEGTTEEPKWCETEDHDLYELYKDFNEWIDSEDNEEIRERYGVENITNASKALFVGDFESYLQEFERFRKENKSIALGEQFIRDNFGDDHWWERNVEHFEQLMKYLQIDSVVPFVGAGLSVEGGFPTWRGHLYQQGKTAGILEARIEDMLNSGHYEKIIEEIERVRNREVFIQELKDVFSKKGNITTTALLINNLFKDTIVTTNYDQLIEQALDYKVQVLGSSNILDRLDPHKTTLIKLHGDINEPTNCILGKNEYNEAYGVGDLNLKKPVPKTIAYQYKTSNLLFLGCSLNEDRTMEVFNAVKEEMDEGKRRSHFSLESMPDDHQEVVERNAYLLSYGITPIWFPKSSYENIELILGLALNELNYRGFKPGDNKKEIVTSVDIVKKGLSFIVKEALRSAVRFN